MGDDKPETTLEPRREATPVPWEELTSDQRKAARDLSSLVAWQARHAGESRFAARRKASASGRGPSLLHVVPPIEHERRAGTYLIDGDRGSGKTALLLSLLEHWGRLTRKEAPWLVPSDGPLDVTHALPIGVMDLRELPPHGALKPHLASMLRNLYEYVDARASESKPLPGAPGHKPNPLRDAWEAFVEATAMDVWEGKDRYGDLATFVDEISRAERERHDLRRLFCDLIDRILDGDAWAKQEVKPIFVVAIDDVDMNPGRVVECFELTQVFSHPRVVYVLTGDQKLFHVALRKALLGELGDEVAARELAIKVYDKVVPRSHRMRLPELPLDDRIEKLADVLNRIESDPHRPTYTALQVLRALPSLAQALPATLREIMDLRAQYLNYSDTGVNQYRFFTLVARLFDEVRERPDVERLLAPVYTTEIIITGERFVEGSIELELDFASHGWTQVRWTIGTRYSAIEHLRLPVIRLASQVPLDPRGAQLGVLATVLLGVNMSQVQLVRGVISLSGERLITPWPFVTGERLEVALVLRAWMKLSNALAGTALDLDEYVRRYFEAHLKVYSKSIEKSLVDESGQRLSWEEILQPMATNFRYDELVLLGAPEYGLPHQLRRKMLDLWRTFSPDYWENTRKPEALRERAKIQGARIESIRAAFGPDDPWTEIMEVQANLGDLEALLDAPLVCTNAWTTRLRDYLTDEFRGALLRDASTIQVLVEWLVRGPKEDERKRLAPLLGTWMNWRGTRADFRGSVATYALEWGELIEHVTHRFAIASPDVQIPRELQPLASRVAFVLAHDLAWDRQLDRVADIRSWPLLRIENRSTGGQAEPWRAPPWATHLDHRLEAAAWQRACEFWTADEGPAALLREFLWGELCTFKREVYAPTGPQSWPELFEAIDVALEQASPEQQQHVRFKVFRTWAMSLSEWLPDPSSLVPDSDLAAMLGELRRFVCEPTSVERLVQALINRKMARMSRHGSEMVDAWVEILVDRHGGQHPALFVKPEARVHAAEALVAAVERLGAGELLTIDLRRMIEDASTTEIRAVTSALVAAQDQGPNDALIAAWQQAGPRLRDGVRWAGGRLVVPDAYDVCAVLFEPDDIDTSIPGLRARYLRGALARHEDTLLAEVFHALLFDRAETSSGDYAPVQWSLVHYEYERVRDITPWPCVQWPARRDLHAQLVGWHGMLDRRVEQSLSAMMRKFVAATVDIYETGQVSGRQAGSWQDVLERACGAVKKSAGTRAKAKKKRAVKQAGIEASILVRDASYRAWVKQLSRFALPRAGLSNAHAAEILVTLWALQPDELGGNLGGRLDHFRQKQLGLAMPSDHPAKLIAESADVASTIGKLRRTYGLG